MSLKPSFSCRESYLHWMSVWKSTYKQMSKDIRQGKIDLKAAQRNPSADRETVSRMAKELFAARVMARKMNTLRKEALLRRDRIIAMHDALREQQEQYPLTIEGCRNVDFHFNKGSLEFPFLPMWTLKTKGKSFYVEHIDAQCPWSTRELPSGSTRGMIRIKRCDITIDKSGLATLTSPLH